MLCGPVMLTSTYSSAVSWQVDSPCRFVVGYSNSRAVRVHQGCGVGVRSCTKPHCLWCFLRPGVSSVRSE